MEQQITRKPDNAFKKLTQFFIVDKVFLVSFIIAVISVSMGGIQTEFFDNKVIVTVFGLMLVIAGFRSTGILSYMGQHWLKEVKQRVSLYDSPQCWPSFLPYFLLMILPY